MLPSLLRHIHRSNKDGQRYITLTDFYNFLKENCVDGCAVAVDRCSLEISVQALGTGYYVNNIEQNIDGKVQILNEMFLSAFTMFKLVFHLSDDFDLCKNIAHEIVNCVLGKAGYESGVKVEESKAGDSPKTADADKNVADEVKNTEALSEDVDVGQIKTEAKTEEYTGILFNEEDIFADITSEDEKKKKKTGGRGKGKVKYKKKLRRRKPFKVALSASLPSSTTERKTTVKLDENIKCDNCDQMFFSMRGLYNHQKKIHKMIVDHSCQQCGKKFKDSYKLNRHKKVHARTKNHICEICGKSFSDSYKLNRHREQHATERNYKCSICDKSFTTKRYVQKHELTHSTERPFQCSTCGEFYKDKRSFQLHMARHGGYEVPAPYKCEECDRVFRNATDLDNHAAMRHRGEKRNICHICGKNFGLRGHVKGHLRTVHKIGITATTKIYKCPYCDKTFMYATSYEAHVSTHTGIKAHKCVICLRNFSTMGNLGAHVKSVHHLPFSKKFYQESLRASQAAEQQNNTDAAGQPQPSGAGTLPLPGGPSLALQAPLPTGGTVLGTGSSLQPLSGTSPANAPIVLYDKKTLLEHYQKIKASQAAEQQNNTDAARQPQPSGAGTLHLPDGPSLALQAPLPTGGTVLGTGSSLQPLPGTSPPANAPIVLYDKKTLLEHYQKKVYQESAPSSNLAAATNVNSNTTSNPENNQDMNGPSSGVQSSQLLVTGGPVTNQGNNTQEIRASAPPVVPAPPPSSTTGGIQTQTVAPRMVHNMNDLARYQDMFVAAHPQHMMTHPPDLSYATAAGNLPLPLYRPPTGPLHGSPM